MVKETSSDPRRWVHLARFILYELVAKSILLCFIATFTVNILLSLTPREEVMIVPVRSQGSYTEGDSASQRPQSTKESIDDRQNFLTFYFNWIMGLLRGSLGRGIAGQNTVEEVKQKFPVTLGLSFSSVIPAFLISFLVGLIGDKSRMNIPGIVICLFAALPAFFLGYLLIAIFGVSLSFSINRYILPVLTLGLSSGIINEMSRVIKNGMDVEMSRDYIETARAKGLGESYMPHLGTVSFHAFRNALIGILPRIGLVFTFIISGSMVVEQVFDLHGLSFMLLEGLVDKDRARVLIVILLAVALVRMGSIISNFLYILLNPRYGQR